MEDFKKTRLSANLLFIKVLFLFVIVWISVLIIQDAKNESSDFKNSIEQKIVLLTFISGFVYFLIIPTIYHDHLNIYINKINKKQIVIPFYKIRSIFQNPISNLRGFTNLTIEYLDNKSELQKVIFRSPYANIKLSKFIESVKAKNPKVQIVNP